MLVVDGAFGWVWIWLLHDASARAPSVPACGTRLSRSEESENVALVRGTRSSVWLIQGWGSFS